MKIYTAIKCTWSYYNRQDHKRVFPSLQAAYIEDLESSNYGDPVYLKEIDTHDSKLSFTCWRPSPAIAGGTFMLDSCAADELVMSWGLPIAGFLM